LSHSSIGVKAADHRDSPTADANPEGDITDMFAFLDPNDTTQLVLIMNVNPFSVPAEAPSYTFSNEFLYQFKFGNDKGPLDDLFIQAKFNGVDTTKCASGQWIKVYGPTRPDRHGIRNTLVFRQPTIEGCTNTTLSNSQLKVFTGQRDDPFVT